MLSFFSKSFLGETEIDSQINSCIDRKSTRLNSSHSQISYAVFCLKKKKIRIRMSRKFRLKMITMTNLSTECLIQLHKLCYDETTRNKILKQTARREMTYTLEQVRD